MGDLALGSGAALSQQQVAAFEQNGYLVVDCLTNSDELSQIRRDIHGLFAERAGEDVGDQFELATTDEHDGDRVLSQIMYPAKYAPQLLESQLLLNAKKLAKQLLGPDAECGFEHAIRKPARHGVATPWHQDAAYWSPNEMHHTISIWVALQETTIENGCLHYAPEPHTNDVFPHQSIGKNPEIHGFELTDESRAQLGDTVACPLRAWTSSHPRRLHFSLRGPQYH